MGWEPNFNWNDFRIRKNGIGGRGDYDYRGGKCGGNEDGGHRPLRSFFGFFSFSPQL